MIKQIVVLIAALFFSFCSLANSNFIPAEQIFVNPYGYNPLLSPNGQRVSMFVNHEDEIYFTITDLVSNQQLLVEGVDDIKYASTYHWITDDLLHFSTSRSDYFVDLNFTTNGIKTEVKKVLYDGYIVHVFPDSKQVLFAKLRPWEDGGFNLHLTSVDTLTSVRLNEKKNLAGPQKRVAHYSYDETTKRIIAKTLDEDEKVITFSYRTLSEPTWYSLLTLEDADYEFEILGFFDAENLAVLSNKSSDRKAFYKYNFKQNQFVELIYEHPRFDLIRADILPTDAGVEPLSVTYFDHGKYRTEYLQQSKEKLAGQVTQAFAGKQWRIVSSNNKTKGYIVYAFDSDYPGAYYLFYPEKKSIELLYEHFPDLEKYRFVKAEVNNIKSPEGIELEYYLTRATTNSHNVLLVNPHGGPIGVRETAAFSRDIQYLVNRGFDVLQVNFRGSEGFGKEFKDSGRGQFGEAIERDITVVVDSVLSQHQYDHVCAMGSSYGAYSSALLAILQPERYECVVASFGIYDLPLLYDSSNIRLHFYSEIFDKILGADSDELYDVSPLYKSEKLLAPILLIAGQSDQTAEIEQSDRMLFVLRELNKDVTPIFYDGTGHGHHKWTGDMHEVISTYDFLIEKLNLKLPKLVSEEDRATLATEYELLADSYTFRDLVPNDDQKAKKYYRKSAELGSAKAMNNYAWLLSQSEEDEVNIAEMLQWFRKAEVAGFGQASFVLGEFYQMGRYVEKDEKKAFEKFLLAEEKGFGAKAKYQVARAKCLGLGTTKNFAECAQTLKEKDARIAEAELEEDKDKDKESSADLFNAYGQLMLSDNLNENEFAVLQRQFMYEFLIDNPALNFDIISIGEYNSYQHLNSTTEIERQSSLYFGIEFDLETTTTFSRKDEKVAFFYIWTSYDKDGLEVSKVEDMYRVLEGKSGIKIPVSEVKDNQTKFVLEVLDLNKTKLYEGTFSITNHQ